MGEVFKTLISTDTFNKDKAPYILCTAIDPQTQNKPNAVEFDYLPIFNREDKYKDIVGFFHTHPKGRFDISPTDADTMKQWVRCLGKSLICLIECEGIVNAWLFTKNDTGEVNMLEVKANTTNAINYYVWTDPTPTFWANADFLVKGEDFYEDDEDPIGDLLKRMDNLENNIVLLAGGLESLTEAIEDLTTMLMDEDDDYDAADDEIE